MATWASDEEIGEVRGVANTSPPPTQSDLDNLQDEFCSDLESLRNRLEKLVRVSQESRGRVQQEEQSRGKWHLEAPCTLPRATKSGTYNDEDQQQVLWLQRSGPFQEGLLLLSKPCSPAAGKLGVVGDSGSHPTNTNQCRCNVQASAHTRQSVRYY